MFILSNLQGTDKLTKLPQSGPIVAGRNPVGSLPILAKSAEKSMDERRRM
jgi:hypothetical protein